MRGGLLIPLHWGTFVLAFHDWSEPADRLWSEAKAEGVTLAVPRPGDGSMSTSAGGRRLVAGDRLIGGVLISRAGHARRGQRVRCRGRPAGHAGWRPMAPGRAADESVAAAA